MKLFKIIIFNIVAVVLLILGTEFYLYETDSEKDKVPFLGFVDKIFAFPDFSEYYESIKENGFLDSKTIVQADLKFRQPVIGGSGKPIVLFGCSFAWGAGLKESETFHYKLAKISKRPVYNRAMSGWGIQYMLFQLQRDDFYKEVPEPEYVIYMYISNHINRMYKYAYIHDFMKLKVAAYNFLKYDDVFNNLKEEHRIIHIPYSRLYNEVFLYLLAKYKENNEKESFKFLEKHFVKSKEEMQKHWKNTKFIIFDYESEDPLFNTHKELLNKSNKEKLEKDGFIVIKSSDLTDIKLGNEYYIKPGNPPGDTHPNEAAWDLLVPLLAKKIKLINN